MATIRKRSGAYQFRTSLGYDSKGQQITKSTTWKPPKEMTAKQAEKEATHQAALFEERARNGELTDGNTRFSDYVDHWVKINSGRYAPKTIQRYKQLLERVVAALGHIKLCALKPHHLENFYMSLTENGANKHTGGGLSDRTIHHLHRVVSIVLGDAFRKGYTSKDASKMVTPPKPSKKAVAYLDELDVKRVVDALLLEPIKWVTAILLLLYTGIRRGELIGLKWSDIDLDNKIIYIRRTVQYLCGETPKQANIKIIHKTAKGCVIEKSPKNTSSERVVAIGDSEIAVLKSYRSWWLQQKLINGDRWIETDSLFIRENGGQMFPDTVNEFIKRFRNKNNLPQFTPHSLRHTNASLLISRGVDIQAVSSRLGHNNATTTCTIYAHEIKSANARAAEKINDILNVHIEENASF